MSRAKEILNKMEETSSKEIKSILTALNSTVGGMGGKYPIGNKVLMQKVKELEAEGKIKYDDKSDKWKKGK